MVRRKRIQLGLGLLALVGMLPVLAAKQRPEVPPAAALASPPPPARLPLAALPVEQWTGQLLALQAAGEWRRLADDLERLRAARPDVYEANALGYLRGRALVEAGDLPAARQALQPHLAAGHPLRDLALYHLARLAAAEGREAEAAGHREELIFAHPGGRHRGQAVADHADYLARRGGSAQLSSFAERLGDSAGASTRRLVQASLVEALLREGQPDAARERGLALLRENTGDDAADRVSRALDSEPLLAQMDPQGWMLVGQAARGHRHFDRAIPLLKRALSRMPERRDELVFDIGRAHFFAEQFAEAEGVYLQGATVSPHPEAQASFLYQAARAAQLRGDDRRAERHLGRAIDVARKRPRTAAPSATASAQARRAVALTQRLRIRAAQKRWGDAEGDLRRVQREFPRRDAAAEATLAYAVALVEAGRFAPARRQLEALAAWRADDSQVSYWLGRAREAADPALALRTYLHALGGSRPTHLAVFARRRIEGPLRAAAQAESQRLAQEAEAALQAGDVARARERQTEAYLLAPPADREARRAALEEIYRRLPEYRAVLELQPQAFPSLPLAAPEAGAPADRLPLLLALGLFDDAADGLAARYPADPLTQAVAFHRAGEAHRSVGAAEALLRRVPADFVPQLLPRQVQELLYPRHFWASLVEEAGKHGSDPRLVLSVMREESRFEVRAKSPAAARGLLQFIIGTARDVGRSLGLLQVEPEDLYQPSIIIPLGARYLADLLGEFGGDRYKAVAAYNAGPHQSRLWARMSPGPGADAFYSSVNFDETRRYVGRVLTSYERYREIYGE